MNYLLFTPCQSHHQGPHMLCTNCFFQSLAWTSLAPSHPCNSCGSHLQSKYVVNGCKNFAFVWPSAASSVLSTVSTASAVLAESTPEPWLLPDGPLSQAGRSCWKQRLINSYQIIPDFLTTSDIHTRPGLTSNQAVHLSYLVLEYVGIILDQCTVYIRTSYLNINQVLCCQGVFELPS